MNRYILIHFIRLALPLFFIRILSNNYTESDVSVWLEFLLYFQFAMQLSESGISLSGPLILKNLGRSKSVVDRILGFQLFVGFLVLTVVLVMHTEMLNVVAVLAGIVNGISLTWIFRFKGMHREWFLSEFGYRLSLYFFLSTGALMYLNILLLAAMYLLVSLVWCLIIARYVYNKELTKADVLGVGLIKHLAEGTALKYLATALYPGLILLGDGFFNYRDIELLKIDKLVQAARGVFSPIVDYLFPKSIKVQLRTKTKLGIVLVGLVLSLLLVVLFPFLTRVLYGKPIHRTSFMYLYSCVPFLMSIVHTFGTFNLVINDRIKIYLTVFLFSILGSMFFLHNGSLYSYIIFPYISMGLILTMIFIFEKYR